MSHEVDELADRRILQHLEHALQAGQLIGETDVAELHECGDRRRRDNDKGADGSNGTPELQRHDWRAFPPLEGNLLPMRQHPSERLKATIARRTWRWGDVSYVFESL